MSKVIEQLIADFCKIPGLGPRSARRAVLYFMQNPEKKLGPMIASLERARDTLVLCDICGNLDEACPCWICQDTQRNTRRLCVLETIGDLWVIEESRVYDGCYHVLGGCLSPLHGNRARGTSDRVSFGASSSTAGPAGPSWGFFRIENTREGGRLGPGPETSLQATQATRAIEEVILANNQTVNGETTARYLHEILREEDASLKITRLACGLPSGGEIEYSDSLTLSSAFAARGQILT